MGAKSSKNKELYLIWWSCVILLTHTHTKPSNLSILWNLRPRAMRNCRTILENKYATLPHQNAVFFNDYVEFCLNGYISPCILHENTILWTLLQYFIQERWEKYWASRFHLIFLVLMYTEVINLPNVSLRMFKTFPATKKQWQACDWSSSVLQK
jgi:hypothetical protein